MSPKHEDENVKSDKAPQFEVLQLYVKDSSFESPSAPEIFTQKWQPKAHLEINHELKTIAKDQYEVNLTLTVNVDLEDKKAYIVEVSQAGIFSVKNFSQEQLNHFLHVYCPEILFPYLRECITNLVVKGGFAPLYIAPVNFEAIFRKKNS